MKSSLIPEKPILVYPSLAATVGLDEAVMLSCLSDMVTNIPSKFANGFYWHSVRVDQLHKALPFWDLRDLQRVSTSLREKGVIFIASGPLLQEASFKFAFNEKQTSTTRHMPSHTEITPQEQAHIARQTNSTFSGKNFISANWKPDQVTLEQLGQLNIPSDFAFRQVPEFIAYWRERNEAHRSWGQKFISHTIQRWRNFEEQENRKNKATAMFSNWQPSQACVDSMLQRGIARQFIFDQIQEFISFWQATGERHIAWESKFIQRVQSEWASQEARRNVSNQGFPIFNSWRPSEDAMEVMTVKSEIPLSFIEDSIAEFIIYWQEKGTESNTWNSLFIKHIRLQWHRYQHALDNSVDPQPISDNWLPSQDVFDILKLANIDQAFAKSLVPEFILYWKDRNEIHRSWNTRFLHHAKRTWAKQHQFVDPQNNQNTLRSTREISLEEELNDTSWAD